MQEFINSLIESGMFDKLYKAGLLSPTVVNYRDIYLFVDAQIRTRHINKEQAVIEAQVIFNCGRATVFRALLFFAN